MGVADAPSRAPVIDMTEADRIGRRHLQAVFMRVQFLPGRGENDADLAFSVKGYLAVIKVEQQNNPIMRINKDRQGSIALLVSGIEHR